MRGVSGTNDEPRAPDVLKVSEPATKVLVVLSHWKEAFTVCVQSAVPEGGGQALLPLKVTFDMVTLTMASAQTALGAMRPMKTRAAKRVYLAVLMGHLQTKVVLEVRHS